MPWGDRTGPEGRGPMTGRCLGYCAGFDVPGSMHPAGGFGRRMARGRARGWRNRYYATGMPEWVRPGYPGPWQGAPAHWGPPTREQELDMLSAQAKALQGQLELLNERIAELTDKEE